MNRAGRYYFLGVFSAARHSACLAVGLPVESVRLARNALGVRYHSEGAWML
jgi:hypothetical protein